MEQTPVQVEGSASADALPVQPEDDVVGYVPRYAMPNISSMLPSYTNSEQDFIFRTFNTGNYDFLKHLPEDIRYQQVVAARTARMEATRMFLMPALSQPLIKSKPDNQQNLFSVFEYIPSRFSLADEIASKERVESEAKRMAIGGKEFTPAGTVNLAKHEQVAEGQMYPYLGGPYEDVDEVRLAHRATEDAKRLPAPFVPSGTDKLAEKPSRQIAWDMMNNLRKWILQDWEGADVAIFENHQDCWVVRVMLSTVDSPSGLTAYMNVFVRCNELVNDYRLTKVVEFWGTTPDDGSMYFVLRPPWVRPDHLQTFFTLHPEERDWRTSHSVMEMSKTRGGREVEDEDKGGARAAADDRSVASSSSGGASSDAGSVAAKGAGGAKGGAPAAASTATALGYTSRLNWGQNFLTGTPAAAALGRTIPGRLHE